MIRRLRSAAWKLELPQFMLQGQLGCLRCNNRHESGINVHTTKTDDKLKKSWLLDPNAGGIQTLWNDVWGNLLVGLCLLVPLERRVIYNQDIKRSSFLGTTVPLILRAWGGSLTGSIQLKIVILSICYGLSIHLFDNYYGSVDGTFHCCDQSINRFSIHFSLYIFPFLSFS